MISLRQAAESRIAVILVLAIAIFTFVYGACSRGSEYDEQYTLFLTSGLVRPDFPDHATTPAALHGHWRAEALSPTPSAVARALRGTDVHPPLYYWLVSGWRGIWGVTTPGLGRLQTRLFSGLCAVIALIGVGHFARHCHAPPALAMAVTIGCYAFSYTAMTARDFALAEALAIWGAVFAVWGAAHSSPSRDRAAYAVSSGLLLGAACYANYLAAFIAAAVLAWQTWQHPKFGLLSCVSSAAFLPAGLWLFLSQRNARIGQFPPFKIQHAMAMIGRDYAAAILGGIPRYFAGPAKIAAYAILLMSLSYIAWILFRRGRRMVRVPALSLAIMGMLAPILGLLLLGFMFNNTPIEIRYFCFSCPFLAVLVANCVKSSGYRCHSTFMLLAIQIVSIAGLLAMPQTMQPISAVVRAADKFSDEHSVVIVPFGNDGVGVAGAFANTALPSTKMIVLDQNITRQGINDIAENIHHLIVAKLATDDASKMQIAKIEAALPNFHWMLTTDNNFVSIFSRSSKSP